MTDRWPEVDAAFDRLLDLPPEERDRALAALDPPVADEVGELLAEADRPGLLDRDLPSRWLERSVAAAGPAERADPATSGERFGPWQIVRRAGAGGMGVVYLARRADGEYEQEAALKVLRRDGLGPDQAARLTAERQILARLDHPAIARLLDGGVGPDGSPYLVLEWVEGRPIDDHVERDGLPVDGRLDLFRAVCEAVETAHRSLVLHRDLKPSNVLVRGDGQPKLLDFGIAKLLDPEQSAVDQTRGAPGTPSSAAPEQIRGEPVGVGVDVWGLGVLLYQLLSGVHPFAEPEASAYAVQARILDGDPEPPSRAVARRRDDLSPKEGRRLAERLAGDLDAIVLRALAARPGDRYGTVGELLDDLDRHRRALPVAARRWTATYRARRFVRRHRLALIGAMVVVALLAALGALGWRHLEVTERQAAEVDRQRLHAEAATDFLVDVFDLSGGGRVLVERQETARALVDRGVARMEADPSLPRELRGTLSRTAGHTYRTLGAPEEARRLFERAVELHSDPRDVVRSLLSLMVVDSEAYRWDDVRRHGERALALTDAADPDDPGPFGEGLWALRGPVLDRLAFVERQTGDLEAAELLARRALDVAETTSDADTRDSAEALLASILARQGGTEEPLRLYRAVLGRQIERLGPVHAAVSRTLNDMAFLLRYRKRWREAEDHYRRALAILDRLYPDSHPQQMVVLQNLASVLHFQGDVDGTRRVLARRVEIAHRLYPGDRRLTESLLGLAKLELDTTGCPAALPYLAEAEAVPAGPEGRGDARMARLLRAACLLEIGDETSGRRLLDQAMDELPAGESLAWYRMLRDLAADRLATAGFPDEAARLRSQTVETPEAQVQ